MEIGLQKYICMYKVIHVVKEGKLWNILLDKLFIKIGSFSIRISGKSLFYMSKATKNPIYFYNHQIQKGYILTHILGYQ